MRDPIGSIVIASLADPALDMSDEELSSYGDSRDASQIKLHAGMRPTLFHLDSIDALFSMDAINNIPGASSRALLAFRASCRRIELPSGESLDAGKLEKSAYGQALSSEAFVRRAISAVGALRVQEVGLVALRFSTLSGEYLDPLSPARGVAAKD